MDKAKPCRTCLAKNTHKNVCELKHEDNSGAEIMLYCLGIQVTDSPEENTKLCLKCYRQILSFYKFKLQAQKNDAILRVAKFEPKIKIEVEVFVNDNNDINVEDNANDSFANDGLANNKVKIELEEIDEDKGDRTSDNELLSGEKNTKYEFGACQRNLNETENALMIVNSHITHKHPCPSCRGLFPSEAALDAHMRLHASEMLFTCEHCHKKSPSKKALKLHIRQVHYKEKTHFCQYCSKGFYGSTRLQIHLRTHTKERPFKCSSCDKAFTSRGVLKGHEMLHSKSNEYKCTLCDKTFNTPKNLRRHLPIHTKDIKEKKKKHACRFCGATFTRNDNRKTHEYTYHTQEACDVTAPSEQLMVSKQV